jgi:hypothetical protein
LLVVLMLLPSTEHPNATGSMSTSTTTTVSTCGIGRQCYIRSNTGGDKIFVFASKGALDEVQAAYTSRDAVNGEIASLMMAGQAYMVPNGTMVTVLDWSGFSGWHQVRIISPDPHTGDVGYILDQWTVFE